MAEQLITFITASVLLTISPGPDIIYVLVQSIANGKKSGIATALGLISGIVIHTSLVALGLALIIKQTPWIFNLVKILGGIYLFYLAYQVYKSEPFEGVSSEGVSSEDVPKNQYLKLYRRGFIMNIINPKVIIFFLAFFPGFLWNPDENVLMQFYVLGALFMTQALIIFSLVALMADKISSQLRDTATTGIIFKWLQIIVFVGIGLFILL